MLPEALKSCPNSNKLHNLVTLDVGHFVNEKENVSSSLPKQSGQAQKTASVRRQLEFIFLF